MNDQEMKEMIGAVCPNLSLDGCYAEIMPRVTAQQLGKLLDTAEQGRNAETWSHLAVKFLQYGQKKVVAAEIYRLVSEVKASYDAAWVLVRAPKFSDEHRDALVKRVTESCNAAWVLWKAPNITPAHQNALVAVVTDSHDAAWVLWNVPELTPANRGTLVPLVKGSNDADQVLRHGRNISDANRAALAKVARGIKQ